MPRGFSKSPAAFDDCRRVLDQALQSPGMVAEFETTGAAVNFRQRCYRYRNILRDLDFERKGGVPGLEIVSAYDDVVIRFIDIPTKPDGKSARVSNKLRFDLNSKNAVRLLDADGTEIEVETPTPGSILDD